MRVWVVRDLEPLPIDEGDPRLMRSAMLCDALVRRGHEVEWITSTFDHYGKRQRAAVDQIHEVAPNYRIALLRAPGYPSNRSPRRVLHNRAFASSFRKFVERATQRPDVIVTDVPTTEAAQAAIHLARLWGIPSLLSIRDLWPDFFGDFLPGVPRPLLRLALSGFERQVAYACRNATSIIGISGNYLQWGLDKGGRQRSALDGIAPLGYRPAVGSDAATQELRERGVDFERQLVTFVGSWGATYDLDTMLDAALLLSERGDIQFVLAGDGDGCHRLAGRIGTMANVVTPGWLSATQIASLLERSALGVAPYHATAPQGLPNKVFEYMAYGVFQIATLRGEAAKMLAELGAGFSPPGNDPRAMADAIVSALDEEQPSERRRRIREAFLARYSADAIYTDLVCRIEALADGTAGAQSQAGIRI